MSSAPLILGFANSSGNGGRRDTAPAPDNRACRPGTQPGLLAVLAAGELQEEESGTVRPDDDQRVYGDDALSLSGVRQAGCLVSQDGSVMRRRGRAMRRSAAPRCLHRSQLQESGERESCPLASAASARRRNV